ncbi:hypothetical protein Bca52824_010494 [Brassica carinata]|uniref:Replication protein A 70 kDa DNA-binding subunit B/D first OB fold domain-containing protein n=1 Tax=Brassica carinata TaxID=52824 RepID=A0A8X7WCT6_BRACI|nr:hypothetical protein Bca52824_010494 [Brassica carinata]
MAGFNSIADMKPFKTMCRVMVSIVRLWKQYSAAAGLTIEIVLIDYNGDKIHASVKKDLVNQFDRSFPRARENIDFHQLLPESLCWLIPDNTIFIRSVSCQNSYEKL